jgi:hypothetical protein
MSTRLLPLIGALALAACATEKSSDKDGAIEALSPREQLIRLSVDLRGVHPSEAELAAIEANPGLYEDYVDAFLDDHRFASRVADLFNARFLTRTGASYGLMAEGFDGAAVVNAANNEQLKLVERIVERELPYSEIVTADYTMANPVLAQALDLDYPDGARGWEKAHYTDGREHAGILSMTTTWLRYPSMGGNANRSRANAVSKMLLCDDYLSRPIVLNRAAVDQLTVDPETAINTNASCQSCHSTLDPLAAHFFGFFVYDDESAFEDPTVYRPEREEGWRRYADKSPAFYGVPTAGLGELGMLIAEDQRFVDCAVETVFEGLTQRDIVDEDWAEVADHQAVFEESGLLIKPLVRSIVTSPEYLAKTVLDEDLAQRIPTVKTVSSAQLSDIVAAKTGFRWTFGGVDLVTNRTGGVPTLLGDIDGGAMSARNYRPSVGTVFVQERLAYAAAWHVVQHDFNPEREGEAKLLKYVAWDATPDSDPEGFETQMAELYRDITGVPLPEDAEEPAALVTLWRQLHSVEGSSEKAWAGVISAVLRDPAVLTY